MSGSLHSPDAMSDPLEFLRREAEMRTDTAEMIEKMNVAFAAFDHDFRFLYLNGEAEAVLRHSREELLRHRIWDRIPGSEQTEFGRGLRRAAEQRSTTRFETFCEPCDRWLEVNAYPMSSGRLGVFFRDITDSKRVQEALRAAKEAAEESSRAKDRFLAVLSHELRTPLSPVLLAVGALEADPTLSPMLHEEMVMIRRNIELETRLIDDLLDISRITSGKLPLHMRAIDLNEKIGHVAHICREQILEKNIRLHLDLHPGFVVVTADAPRLQQVLWNVLKNAAKFTPKGGDIRVSTRVTDDGSAQVVVRDTGVGIAPDAIPSIFDAFEQGGAEITREFGGLGLGLAISKVLVELHGGSIHAQSPGLGLGSTFTITLPGAQASGESCALPPPERSREDRRNIRLLIVEDHGDTVRVLARLLGRRGFTVRTAGSVAAAIDALREDGRNIDLILSDVGLPDGTGYELMQRASSFCHAAGIAMSGFGLEEDIRRSREAGFAEHLVKPVDAAQIEEAILRLLPGE